MRGYIVQGNITIKRISYVDGFGHNLFGIGQFCDKDLEVVFRKRGFSIHTQEGEELLQGTSSNLYTLIS